MDPDSKSVAAILYGVAFVVGLKLTQLILGLAAPSFAALHSNIVLGLAAICGAICALVIVGKVTTRRLK